MSIIKFGQFIKESSSTDETVFLFRLVAVAEGEDLVVNTKSPGMYYFRNKSDLDPALIDKEGDEYHIIKVSTPESNIDEESSEKESDKNGCDCAVLIDDSLAKVEEIVPYK